MRPRDLSALDFPRVAARVADFAASAAGQERCRGLAPTADQRAADAALERAWQLHRLLERHGDPLRWAAAPAAALCDQRRLLRARCPVRDAPPRPVAAAPGRRSLILVVM